MKKILCMLMAVLAIGCLAGCTMFKDHDDGVCDKCDKETNILQGVAVVQWEKNKELCWECADEEYTDEELQELLKEKGEELGDVTLGDIADLFGGNKD